MKSLCRTIYLLVALVFAGMVANWLLVNELERQRDAARAEAVKYKAMYEMCREEVLSDHLPTVPPLPDDITYGGRVER